MNTPAFHYIHALASDHIFLVPNRATIPQAIRVTCGKPCRPESVPRTLTVRDITLVHDYHVRPDGTTRRDDVIYLLHGDKQIPLAPGPARTLSRLLGRAIQEVA